MAIRGKPCSTQLAHALSRSLLMTAFITGTAACDSQDPSFADVSSGRQLASSADAEGVTNPEQMSQEDLERLENLEGLESELARMGEAVESEDGDGTPDYGEGEEPPADFELYSMELTQQADKKVDILWVVDSSGSMAEEQSYLGQKFNSFISALANSGTNFQTAVTTTDVCQDPHPTDLKEIACPIDYNGSTNTRGSFMGDNGRKVLSSTDNDLVAKFNQYTSVGTNGSGFEHGLKGAQLAISKVLSGDNEDLLRDNSFLSIIVVSDEEDDGIGLGMTDGYSNKNFVNLGLTEFSYTHNDLQNYLTGVVGAGNFSISTITGTKDNAGNLCQSAHSKPKEEGSQYIAAATATGGIVQSICDTDWDNSLYNIGKDINAQISQIALAVAAFTPSIKVYVDDELNTDWTYIAGTNVVKFNSDAIPADGSDIKVTYYGPKN